MNKLPYIFSLLLLLSTTFGTKPAQAQDRKGWSPQAKGAVIGGGSGAILGAVINKRNRTVGGVVGGVAGAGVGYAIGKHRDNKNKERARIAEANRIAANREAAYRNALARSNRANARTETGLARNRANALPANSLVATAAAYDAQGMAVPAAPNAAYLPNDAHGDPSHPYATSEYLRKSW